MWRGGRSLRMRRPPVLAKCQEAIDYAEAARDLQVCHWGFRYSKGVGALMPYLAQMRFLAFVLLADSDACSLDGN